MKLAWGMFFFICLNYEQSKFEPGHFKWGMVYGPVKHRLREYWN
jgi:hypothetical protein